MRSAQDYYPSSVFEYDSDGHPVYEMEYDSDGNERELVRKRLDGGTGSRANFASEDEPFTYSSQVEGFGETLKKKRSSATLAN